MYVYTYMHIIAISQKISHEFEREPVDVYGRLRGRKGNAEML